MTSHQSGSAGSDATAYRIALAQIHEDAPQVFSPGPIVHPRLVQALGAITAIVLAQADYLARHLANDDGWFYHERERWERGTGLSRMQIERARATLRRLDLLEESYDRAAHRHWFHLRIDSLRSFVYKINQQTAVGSGQLGSDRSDHSASPPGAKRSQPGHDRFDPSPGAKRSQSQDHIDPSPGSFRAVVYKEIDQREKEKREEVIHARSRAMNPNPTGAFFLSTEHDEDTDDPQGAYYNTGLPLDAGKTPSSMPRSLGDTQATGDPRKPYPQTVGNPQPVGLSSQHGDPQATDDPLGVGINSQAWSPQAGDWSQPVGTNSQPPVRGNPAVARETTSTPSPRTDAEDDPDPQLGDGAKGMARTPSSGRTTTPLPPAPLAPSAAHTSDEAAQIPFESGMQAGDEYGRDTHAVNTLGDSMLSPSDALADTNADCGHAEGEEGLLVSADPVSDVLGGQGRQNRIVGPAIGIPGAERESPAQSEPKRLYRDECQQALQAWAETQYPPGKSPERLWLRVPAADLSALVELCRSYGVAFVAETIAVARDAKRQATLSLRLVTQLCEEIHVSGLAPEVYWRERGQLPRAERDRLASGTEPAQDQPRPRPPLPAAIPDLRGTPRPTEAEWRELGPDERERECLSRIDPERRNTPFGKAYYRHPTIRAAMRRGFFVEEECALVISWLRQDGLEVPDYLRSSLETPEVEPMPVPTPNTGLRAARNARLEWLANPRGAPEPPPLPPSSRWQRWAGAPS